MFQDSTWVLVEEADQFLAAAGLLQLADGFGFDLTNTLAGYLKNVTDFFKRVAVAITEAVTKLDDLAFAIAQRLQDILNTTFEHFLRRTDRWAFGFTVRQKIAEVAVFAVADRTIKADRIATHRQYAACFFDSCFAAASNFFESRFATEFLK